MIPIVLYILEGLCILIIADAVLSWVQGPDAFPRSLTARITAPLYAPVHLVLKPGALGGLDLAPLIVLILLQVVANALRSAASGGF